MMIDLPTYYPWSGRKKKSIHPLTYIKRAALILFIVSVLPVIALRWFPPPTSAFMLQQYVLARWSNQDDSHIHYRWVDLEEISPHAVQAVIAAEDQKFSIHWGFDREAIAEAWKERRKGTRIRGASTITQQVAKNLFLWPGKTFIRKGIEAYFTVLIEALWSKSRIVEIYLNIVQFGRNVYGISEAGKIFFGKAPSDLNRKECALMAAALPNPLRLRIDRPSEYMRQRTQQILKEMSRMGRIDLSRSVRLIFFSSTHAILFSRYSVENDISH
jgi:monofunctional biosynthetic peptidoglycan transglycosylase